jgi:hypothetical protein
MKRALDMARQILRTGSATALSLVLWTLWLGLSLALALQIYIALARELAVPNFVLRRVERELAETGVRAKFAKTIFDPTGRVLVEKLELSLPEFPEPVVRARSVYLQLNPWALTVGRFVPEEIRVTGVEAAVPAMLSPSGRPEEVVQSLDATLVPAGTELRITHLSARVAGIALTARGAIALPKRARTQPPQSLAETVSMQFPRLCRQLVAIKSQLDGLEEPALHLELTPSDARLAMVDATLFARSLSIEHPLVAHLQGLRLDTRVARLGDAPATSDMELSAEELRLPLNASARGVRAALIGRFLPGGYQFEPRELRLTADAVEASGFTAGALSARLFPQPLPQMEADVVTQILGAPLAVQANVDFKTRAATLRFGGTVSPQVLTPLSAQLRTDVRKYFDFTTLECIDGEARLGPGWEFEGLTAHVDVRGINAYHVAIDEGRANIALGGGWFRSPDAYARIGENFARGSYEQSLATHQYRFLLQGRLRPLDISGWFREWWPNFFHQLEFPAAPPAASVDVAGFWGEGRRSTTFVFADAGKTILRGAPLDRVRTRLFIRPTYFDGLDVLATRDKGTARGTFTYVTNPETHERREFDFDFTSNLDLGVASRIIGPASEAMLAPFKFARPPELRLSGKFTAADAPQGAHESLRLKLFSDGEFRFHDFPLENVSFDAALLDGEVNVDNINARFAGGAALGQARVTGADRNRKVGFTVTLRDASLGQAADALQHYAAEINHRPVPPPGKFVQQKANVRLDLAAVAEGRYGDPYSLQGDGTAALRGEEIGEVPLLGLLSGLLKFTALRFTSANAKFKINGTKLEFSEFALRGANSGIDAHGDYALDKRELDFKAKVFPFQESNSLIKSVVGAVLSPISNVFEVKLTGSLEKPEWAFVMGPTNFLRALAPDAPGNAKPGETAPPAPTPPTSPDQAPALAPGKAVPPNSAPSTP